VIVTYRTPGGFRAALSHQPFNHSHRATKQYQLTDLSLKSLKSLAPPTQPDLTTMDNLPQATSTDRKSRQLLPEIRHKHPMLANLIMREVNALQLHEPRVLEAGCETGWFAQHFVGQGSFVGLDQSAEAFAPAAHLLPSARFIAADYLTWASDEPDFDLVLSVEQLAMCPDHTRALDVLTRKVRPGGYLMISTENPFVYNRMAWMNTPLLEGEVRNRIRHRDLHALVRQRGFNILRSFTFMPMGSSGVLWLFNAEGINRIAGKIVPRATLERWKERFGLGQFRIVVARKTN